MEGGVFWGVGGSGHSPVSAGSPEESTIPALWSHPGERRSKILELHPQNTNWAAIISSHTRARTHTHTHRHCGGEATSVYIVKAPLVQSVKERKAFSEQRHFSTTAFPPFSAFFSLFFLSPHREIKDLIRGNARARGKHTHTRTHTHTHSHTLTFAACIHTYWASIRSQRNQLPASLRSLLICSSEQRLMQRWKDVSTDSSAPPRSPPVQCTSSFPLSNCWFGARSVRLPVHFAAIWRHATANCIHLVTPLLPLSAWSLPLLNGTPFLLGFLQPNQLSLSLSLSPHLLFPPPTFQNPVLYSPLSLSLSLSLSLLGVFLQRWISTFLLALSSLSLLSLSLSLCLSPSLRLCDKYLKWIKDIPMKKKLNMNKHTHVHAHPPTHTHTHNTHTGKRRKGGGGNYKAMSDPLARVNYPDAVWHGCLLRVTNTIKASRDLP